MGMHVVGTFTVIGDEDAFVWIRRFEDAADRDHILEPSTEILGARG
jgi:hypothetical protein